MKQDILLFAAASLFIASLAGCGGGGNSAPTTVSTPVVDPAITAAIQANMNMNYSNDKLLLSTSIQTCFRQNSGGAAISCSISAKQVSAQNFLNTVLANIQAVKINTPIDNAAIATMLSTYQAQDLAWLTVNSLSPTYTMTSGELATFTPSYDSSVNTSYSNALVQFNAITIQANMDTNYNNEKILLSNWAIENCFRQNSGGAAISCSINTKQAFVQNFLNTVLANIQTVKNNTPIDKAAIETMLSTYQTQDLAWLTVNSLSPTYTMTSAELAAVKPTYNSSVNTSYSNALIQLTGM